MEEFSNVGVRRTSNSSLRKSEGYKVGFVSNVRKDTRLFLTG